MRKLRIIVSGLFDNSIYITSKLKNEIIPEVLKKFPDCTDADIEFVCVSSVKGVSPHVLKFVRENGFGIKEFRINWNLGKERSIQDVNTRMIDYALEYDHAYVVMFWMKRGKDITLYAKTNTVMEQRPLHIGIKEFIVR